MKKYIIKNALNSLLIIFGVLTISFILTYSMPGDPVKIILGERADAESIKSLNTEMGLDKPFYVRYFKFILNSFQGKLGKSYLSNQDVLESIIERLPATIILSFTATIIAAIAGILLGIISSVKRYSLYDTIATLISLIGISIPQFILALLMVYLFASQIKIFPVSGYINNGLIYLILPAVSLSLRPMAIIMRITRSSMLEILGSDYVRTARAKGLPERTVIFKHSLKNALNPVITSISTSLAATLAGVFFIEYIFNWPGIGSLTLDSIMKLDYPMIQGTILFTAVSFVLINLFVDILYALTDPKIRLA